MIWRLHHGDCLDWLPTLGERSVDHTICDPPYEAESHSHYRRVLTRNGRDGRPAQIDKRQHDFDPITERERAAVSREIVRVTRGWALVFCQVEGAVLWRDALVAAGASHRRIGVWHKLNFAPQISGDRPAASYECIAIAWCGEGRSRWSGGGSGCVWAHSNPNGPGGQRIGHPTEKPISLLCELVSLFTQPGDLVLDPYAGSGTTGAACLRLGRRFVGAERAPHYYEMGRARLDAEARGISAQAASAGQRSLFGGEP